MNNPIGFIKFKARQFHQGILFEVFEQSRSPKQYRLIGWDIPPKGWYKINSDGAMKTSSGILSAGGLLRDDQGRWMAGFAVNLGRCSALVAEIWGALYALQLAWERNVKKVILEMDRLPVVHIFKNGSKNINGCHALVMDIRHMLSLDWEVHIQHVFREGNRAADSLANFGAHLPLGYHLLQNLSTQVYEIMTQDIVGVSFYHMCN